MKDNESDLMKQFVQFEWLLRRYQLHNHRAHGPMADPHRGQGRVLALLMLKSDISQKDLSSILNIRSQSLGELLGKLERSGYITRTPSETDRRIMELHLTDAGREAAEQKEQQPDSNQLFACLNDEEQATLSRYMSRIINNMAQAFGNDDEDTGFRERPLHDRPLFGRGGFDFHPGANGGQPDFSGRRRGRPLRSDNNAKYSDDE